jgi:hypothetical protein
MAGAVGPGGGSDDERFTGIDDTRSSESPIPFDQRRAHAQVVAGADAEEYQGSKGGDAEFLATDVVRPIECRIDARFAHQPLRGIRLSWGKFNG